MGSENEENISARRRGKQRAPDAPLFSCSKEILDQICGYLSGRDLTSLARVNRSMYGFIGVLLYQDAIISTASRYYPHNVPASSRHTVRSLTVIDELLPAIFRGMQSVAKRPRMSFEAINISETQEPILDAVVATETGDAFREGSRNASSDVLRHILDQISGGDHGNGGGRHEEDDADYNHWVFDLDGGKLRKLHFLSFKSAMCARVGEIMAQYSEITSLTLPITPEVGLSTHKFIKESANTINLTYLHIHISHPMTDTIEREVYNERRIWAIINQNLQHLTTIILNLCSKRTSGYKPLPQPKTDNQVLSAEAADCYMSDLCDPFLGRIDADILYLFPLKPQTGDRINVPHLSYEYVPHLGCPSTWYFALNPDRLVSLSISATPTIDGLLLHYAIEFRRLRYLQLSNSPVLSTIYLLLQSLPNPLEAIKLELHPKEKFDFSHSFLGGHYSSLMVLWINSANSHVRPTISSPMSKSTFADRCDGIRLFSNDDFMHHGPGSLENQLPVAQDVKKKETSRTTDSPKQLRRPGPPSKPWSHSEFRQHMNSNKELNFSGQSTGADSESISKQQSQNPVMINDPRDPAVNDGLTSAYSNSSGASSPQINWEDAWNHPNKSHYGDKTTKQRKFDTDMNTSTEDSTWWIMNPIKADFSMFQNLQELATTTEQWPLPRSIRIPSSLRILRILPPDKLQARFLLECLATGSWHLGSGLDSLMADAENITDHSNGRNNMPDEFPASYSYPKHLHGRPGDRLDQAALFLVRNMIAEQVRACLDDDSYSHTRSGSSGHGKREKDVKFKFRYLGVSLSLCHAVSGCVGGEHDHLSRVWEVGSLIPGVAVGRSTDGDAYGVERIYDAWGLDGGGRVANQAAGQGVGEMKPWDGVPGSRVLSGDDEGVTGEPGSWRGMRK